MVVASHVYVGLDVVNNDMTSDASAPTLRFQETRNAPYMGRVPIIYVLSQVVPFRQVAPFPFSFLGLNSDKQMLIKQGMPSP